MNRNIPIHFEKDDKTYSFLIFFKFLIYYKCKYVYHLFFVRFFFFGGVGVFWVF